MEPWGQTSCQRPRGLESLASLESLKTGKTTLRASAGDMPSSCFLRRPGPAAIQVECDRRLFCSPAMMRRPAQPPGSAAGLPFEAASAKNGSRPPLYTERYWLGHRNRYRYRYRKEKEGQKIQETIWKSGKQEGKGQYPLSVS